MLIDHLAVYSIESREAENSSIRVKTEGVDASRFPYLLKLFDC